MTRNAKPTLLFLHGFRGDHHGLRFIAEHFTADYEVLLPDLPPFGRSRALPTKHDLDAYAEWLKNYINENSPDAKPIIIAHSMGTIVATYFASKYPDTIDHRLVLISPISRTPASRKRSRAAFRVTDTALTPFSDNFAKRVLASRPVTFAIFSYMTSTKDKTTRQLIRREHYEYSGRFDTAPAFLESMELSMTRDCLEFAPDLKDKKVCVIAGAKDQLTPAATSREFVRATDADFHLIDDTGHLIVYEEPEKTAQIIREFLAKN